MSNQVWYEITSPFPNFNGCTVEFWPWISNFIPHFIMDYLSILGLKLTMLVKGPPGYQQWTHKISHIKVNICYIKISLKFVHRGPTLNQIMSSFMVSPGHDKLSLCILLACPLIGTWKMPYSHIEAEAKWMHFPDDILKSIFVNENVWFRFKFHLSLFLRVQLTIFQQWFRWCMAWRRSGDKPLSEPMVSLLMHICITQPQKLIMLTCVFLWYVDYSSECCRTCLTTILHLVLCIEKTFLSMLTKCHDSIWHNRNQWVNWFHYSKNIWHYLTGIFYNLFLSSVFLSPLQFFSCNKTSRVGNLHHEYLFLS